MVATTFIFTVVSMALSASASCVHGTSFLKRQVSEDGKKVEVSNFGYSGERGPVNWASLAPENEACRTGKIQSPIDLDTTISKATEKPVVKIANVEEAEFENLGTTLETIVTGTTTFGGKEFTLKQFHMHTPSEHRINNEYFPLEIHMVHEAADKSIAVIALPFQLTEDGKTTELLTNVIANIDKATEPGSVTTTGPLDFAPIVDLIQTKALFQYTGSLTTPPCAEGLTFLVMEEPLPLNVATFNKIKKVIGYNARTIQNQLNKQNILTIAEDLAITALGAGAGDKVEGVPSNLDGNTLAELLAAARNSSTVEVFTTVTTQTKIVTNGQGGGVIEAPEEDKVEAPKAEEGKVEAPKAEEGKKEEAPKAEEGKKEEGVKEPTKVNIEVPKVASPMEHKPKPKAKRAIRAFRRGVYNRLNAQ